MTVRPMKDVPTEQLIVLAKGCIYREKEKNRVRVAGEALHAHAIEELICRFEMLTNNEKENTQ